MQFSTDLQKATYERVLGFMKEIFGESAASAGDFPMISVMLGSAVTLVSVLPLREDEVVVTTRAIVVSRPVVTPELAVFLLRANSSMMFGAFSLSPRGDVMLEHNIIGSAIDKDELRVSILTVARVADDYDDLIVARWGGERALDKIDSLARLMEFEEPGAVSH